MTTHTPPPRATPARGFGGTKQNQMERPRLTFRFASKALKKAAEERMAMMGISTLTGYINALIGRDISKRK
jgi:hypothetical protein